MEKVQTVASPQAALSPSVEGKDQPFPPKGETGSETVDEPPSSGLSELLRLVRPERNRIILAGLLATASVLMGLMPFILIYRMSLELVWGQISAETLWPLAWGAALAVILRFVFFGISLLVAHAAAFAFLYELRVRLARTLGDLPLGFFNTHSTGEIKKVLNEDVEKIEIFVAHQLPDLVSAAALPLLTAAYLVSVDWRMTLASLAVFPFAMAAQTWMMHDYQLRW